MRSEKWSKTAKEWSQSEMADKLAASRQRVNAIKTERYDPSLLPAFKVACLFKLPMKETFEDNDL